MDPKPYVQQRNGGYYVSDTRVSLDSIAVAFQQGLSPETILQEFDTLTLAQVYGAIAFYLDNQRLVDAYLSDQQRRFESVRRFAEPLPELLRLRLDAARESLREGVAA